MMPLIQIINPFAEQWTAAMTAVLWQSMLLAAVVAAVCLAIGQQSPRVRYWIWVVLAAKLLLLPLWSVELALPTWNEPAALPAEATTSVAADVPITTTPSLPVLAVSPATAVSQQSEWAPKLPWFETATWHTWLFAIWTVVVLIEIGRTAWQYVRLRTLLAAARPVDRAIEALVDDCAQTLGLRASPAVQLMDVDGSPLVCGPLRPVLLLPATYADRFDPQSLRQVVLHELAHVRRGDLFTVWIFHAMRTVYWLDAADGTNRGGRRATRWRHDIRRVNRRWTCD
jgi:bla regulator protein blaR1